MSASLRKAPYYGAFFVFLFWLFLPLRISLAEVCQPPVNLHEYTVSTVVDGDTLRLANGRKVRLIGIDTPELGRDGAPDAPYAAAAHTALEQLVERSANRVRLQLGLEDRDRYRRILAHAYSKEGKNLGAELLRLGLGYQAVVAPNLNHIACYRQAEAQARQNALGLWSQVLPDAAAAQRVGPGFHLMQGQVERVAVNHHAVWLELQAGVTLKLPRKVWREMDLGEPEAFRGRRLEVRGWFYRHQGRLKMTLSHPAAIRWL
jgi:endonuclease YncB( thermonuclease family)